MQANCSTCIALVTRASAAFACARLRCSGAKLLRRPMLGGSKLPRFDRVIYCFCEKVYCFVEKFTDLVEKFTDLICIP